MKDVIDKYFKTDSILAEILISLLVGVGGFSTLLPKTVESISTARDYTSFDALTYFSLIYFLLPGFIVTTYWQYRGWKKFIDQKLKDIGLIRNDWSGVKIGSFYCTICKAILIFLLFYHRTPGVSFIFILYVLFLLISLIEACVCARNIIKYTAFDENSIFIGGRDLTSLRNVIFFIRDKAVTITTLISLINTFIGVGLCLIIKPWLLYWDFTIILFNTGLSIYLIILVLLIKYNTLLYRKINSLLLSKENKNRFTEDEYFQNIQVFSIRWVFPISSLLLGFYFIPTVNRYGEQFSSVSLLVFVIVCSFLLFEEIKRFSISAIVCAALVFLTVIGVSFFSTTYLRSNQKYLENRLKATTVFPTEAIFPLLGKLDESALRARHRKNFELLTGASNLDGKVADLFGGKDTEDLRFKYNLRAYYYPQYDQYLSRDSSIEKIMDNYWCQESIDSFYDQLFHHIEDAIMLKAYDAKKTIKLDIVDFYLHPVSYFSNLVQYSYEQVGYLKELLHLIEQYKRIHPDTSKNDSSTVLFSNGARDFYTVKLRGSFQEARSKLVDVDQSLNIEGRAKSETKAHYIDFLNFKKYVYYDYYSAAQVIYQSYLNDYQRIGLFVFGGTILILGFTVYYSYQDRRFSQGGSGKRPAEVSMLTVSLIVLLVLALPMCRKIEAENINPEQKYWMMNIANWYTPKLFEDVANPEEKEEPALRKLDTVSVSTEIYISGDLIDDSRDSSTADTVIINQHHQHNHYYLDDLVDVDALKEIKETLDKFVNQ